MGGIQNAPHILLCVAPQKKFYKNAKKHLQHRETCAIIHLGCGRLVQNKQAAQAAICVDAGGCRRKAEGLAGFSAEYVRS